MRSRSAASQTLAIPVAPARLEQVLFAAAVPGQLHSVNGETVAIQALGDQAHLRGRAGQTMDEQDPGAAARILKSTDLIIDENRPETSVASRVFCHTHVLTHPNGTRRMAFGRSGRRSSQEYERDAEGDEPVPSQRRGDNLPRRDSGRKDDAAIGERVERDARRAACA